jgi:DtxR family Mn-dependent transcriptional regulator
VPYKGVRLTDNGVRLALEILRHHRLLELYLTEALGVPWDRVHAEAEVLEHVLSEDLEELSRPSSGTPRAIRTEIPSPRATWWSRSRRPWRSRP